tara:strand:- start:233 stop:754 length:522 start_codon:yes stop_codon:yes gene_type:complete
MTSSGARANISQVRQLVGMRGLMSDPKGNIIDVPITSNFREGLSVTEYIISSYGARKGLVDTSLRTADSGYLTRRLVDVAQDITVKTEDCGTTDFIMFSEFHNENVKESIESCLVGRVLAKPLFSKNKIQIASPNQELTVKWVRYFKEDLKYCKIRSPLTCNAVRSVCQKCYG